MTETQLIKTENLEKLALNCFKSNPNPKRGPKTIEGKKKSLANLKRKTKSKKNATVNINPSDFSFRFIDLNGEKEYSHTQKKFYKKRYKNLIRNAHVPTHLTMSMIHNFILIEMDIKNLFRQLSAPNLTLKQAQSVRKMLSDTLETYKKLYAIIAPEQYGRDLEELFNEVFPENEPESKWSSPASCQKDWLLIRGIDSNEIDMMVAENREKLIQENITNLRKEWKQSDDEFMVNQMKRIKLAEIRKSYTTGQEEMDCKYK
jgi:hypothetical protein